ncbi:MAG: CBS domain-containing protein, partial [Planctomycetota bacterium]
VGEALTAMRDRSIGCVLIVAKGRLAGIFSERDALMRLGAAGATRHAEPLVKYMTPNPAVISASEKIAFALHKMEVGGYRHLPVLDGDTPVSIVSIRDLLRYITQHDRDAA